MSTANPKLWTKNFITCSVVNFLTAICFYLLMIVVSVYSISKFHSSPGEAGFSASIFVIGGFIARLFFGKWIGLLGYKPTLYIGTILSFVTTFLYFGINSLSMPKIKLTEKQLNEIKGFKLANFFESKVIPISTIGMLVYFSYSSVVSFLAVYSQKIHLENAAGFFFIIYVAIIVVSRPFIGRLFDIKGENIIMYPSIILFTLGMILFSQSHYGYMLLLAAGLIGFGIGAIQSSTQAIPVKLTSQHRMDLANSPYFTLLDIGMRIGPLLVGLLILFIGYRGMYLIVAIAGGALSLLLYYLLHGKKH